MVTAPPPPLFPPGGTLTPAAIVQVCSTQLALARRRVNAIAVRPGPRTFASVTAALEDAESDLADNLAAAQFLALVSPDAPVRAASARCGSDVAAFSAATAARPDIYAALVAAGASGSARRPDQRALQTLAVGAARRSGAGLAARARAEFVRRERTLTDLANGYASVLAGDSTTLPISAAQAASLPPEFVATLRPLAAGGYTVPVAERTAATFMANQTDAAARRAYYVAYYRRGGTLNAGFVRQALTERVALAHVLGFRSWAADVTADRMAGSPARVDAFLRALDDALLPRARAEYAQLAAAKGSPLDPWDVTFYQNRVRAERYGIDTARVAVYFPAPHVIDGVLDLAAGLFGLQFRLAPELPRWDPAVLAYTVTDSRTGAPRGTLYLDLYARPGKLDHLANAPLRARRVLAGGEVRPAVNAILGDWSPPVDGGPALLAHRDVVAFMHEFGHNLAALLADTPYETLNTGVPLDFLEAPAETFEELAWEPAALSRLSAGPGGRTLPPELIARLIAARRFDAAYATVVQTFYAALDQRLHAAVPPADITAVWASTLAELTPLRFVAGTLPQASFVHLMNGYEGGYYAYLWSRVYAADMAAALAPGGVPDPLAGARLREDVLAPARAGQPDTEMERFFGRPADARAFYRALGLDAKRLPAAIR